MQYLLTNDEFQELSHRPDLTWQRVASEAIAQMRRMIVPKGNCIHDMDGPEYCDECPLSWLGGNAGRPTREMSARMCSLTRDYSK